MLPFRRGAAWQTLFLLCALAYCINVVSSEGRVVCYYTNWSVYRPGTAKFNPQNINPYLCTHLVYAFGGFTKDNQMKPFDKYQDIEQGGYAKFTGLKTYNKQLKTMIAIGGWNEASSRFSPLVANPERRQQFIKNILKFLRQNHFDGIDLDWEYPAHREGGKSRDRDNYAQFVQELRAEFEREAEKTGRTRLLLTMAVPAGIEYIDKGYDVPKLNKYLDWFNVLTYDFHSSHEPSVNHHAPLYSLEEDSEYNYDAELNIDYSIKYYLKAGADRDKLVLGIPTYGRSYTLINEESTELGAPSEGPGEQGDATREKGYLAYYEICQNLKDDPEWTIVQPNANVMGPYAYRRNQWVGYDDEAIVRKKAEYVVAQGLGGIMFWAIDNDDFRGTCSGKPYPLIEAAKEAMIESLGLGINEVAKSSGPQKPSRSRSRTDNGSTTRNRLNSKPALGSTRRPTSGSSGRRPAASSTTTTTTTSAPPSTNIRLTEAEGSSLYIGGRASTTPPPPTTPDPGSDFKCEEEGFFQHPRDCKKYYWCLDSGPSGLGIVAHQFTCPSGLYFNPAADSCDFARNVPCKTKKSTTAAPQTSPIPTTTVRTNRVTAAPPAVARPIYPRTTTTTTSTTTTTTTRPSTIDDESEYEEEADTAVDDADDDEARRQPGKSKDAEEDPQVIKELIDLIRKVGGIEQLEKHLLRNKDGSITLKENSSIGNAGGAATTPSTISKSLYDRVLSRQGTLSSLTRKTSTFKVNSEPTTGTTTTTASPDSNYSKYSSVLRGNSRQGPQNEGIEKLSEFDGFLKERKEYVTINRNRNANKSGSTKTRQGEQDEDLEEEEGEQLNAEAKEEEEPETSTRRPYSPPTPSYTSLRRTRPSTVAPAAPEEEPEQERKPIKSYSTLGNTRGRSTEKPETPTTLATGTESASSLSTNRYKYFERTRPTKSTTISASSDDTEEDDEEYDEEPQQQQQQQQQNVTVLSKQSLTSTTNTRKYASIGRSRTTTTTTATPETTTTRTTTTFTETAKANSSNNVLSNNIIQTEEEAAPPPPPPSTTHHPETLTILNEITEPIESTSITNLTLSTTNQTPTTTNTHTPTPTPTPNIETTTITIESQASSIDSLSLTDEIELTTQLPVSVLNNANPTPIPILKITTTTTTGTTTTADELATTTTATATSTTSNDINDVNNDHIDSDEVTQSPSPNQTKYLTISQRRKNAEAVNDASLNSLNSSSSSSNIPNVNSFRTTYSGRRQPQKTPQQQQSEQEPKLTKTKSRTTTTPTTTTTNPDLNLNDVGNRISSPRPFGYPRRRTRPTTTTTTTPTSTTIQHSTDNDNINEAVENTVKTRLSQVDRSKVSASHSHDTTQTNTNTTTTTTNNNKNNHVDVAGNGGNSLRHEVVSSSLSTDQNRTTSNWRTVRRPSRRPAVNPNTLDTENKDSRRYAGKRLDTDEENPEIQVDSSTKYRSRRLNSAEQETEAANEAKNKNDTAPLPAAGLLQSSDTTNEDENIAAEIIDDEPPAIERGKTKAPSQQISDDSNTATEQEDSLLDTTLLPDIFDNDTTSTTTTTEEPSFSSSTEPQESSTESKEDVQITSEASFINEEDSALVASTETTSTEGSAEAPTEATTRRSFLRNKFTTTSTVSSTSTTTEENVETTTSTPSRRRVIVRGKYRPSKEGDLSSLLAADANKRVNSRTSTNNGNNTSSSSSSSSTSTTTTTTTTTPVPAASEDNDAADKVKKTFVGSQRETKKLNSRTPLNGQHNRTSTKVESLGNGITRTRTTNVRTIDAGRKVVKKIHTKIVEEKPAEYEYVYDEVSQPLASTTTPRTITRNRGSVKFQSNDLSSLLALDFASRGSRNRQSENKPTVTKTRRRLLKRPKETIEREEVEEYEYETDDEVNSDSLLTTTTAKTIERRTRPTRIATTPTTRTTTRASTTETNPEVTTRRIVHTFKRPTTSTTTTTTTTTEEPSTPSTSSSAIEEDTTEDQLAAAKQRFVSSLSARKGTSTSTSTTTSTTTETPPSTTLADDLSALKQKYISALNRLQTNNDVEANESTTTTPSSEQDDLSLPIYHRRKYYQYVKDSPITYIDKSPAPPDIESVTVNIRQQIHDVFNVSENSEATGSNSVDNQEETSSELEQRLAMEQAREINSELGHFLLKTPGSM